MIDGDKLVFWNFIRKLWDGTSLPGNLTNHRSVKNKLGDPFDHNLFDQLEILKMKPFILVKEITDNQFTRTTELIIIAV